MTISLRGLAGVAGGGAYPALVGENLGSAGNLALGQSNRAEGFAGNGDWINIPISGAGTLDYYNNSDVLQWSKAHTDINAAVDAWIGFTFDATDNLIYVFLNAGQAVTQVRDGGVTQTQANIGASNDGAFNRYAQAYKLNDLGASINGGSTVLDTSATIPAVTKAILGNPNGFNQLNGHIKSIVYYDVRLTDAQLEELST